MPDEILPPPPAESTKATAEGTQPPYATSSDDAEESDTHADDSGSPVSAPKAETGGPKGLEPTRYGDWERNGRCYDF